MVRGGATGPPVRNGPFVALAPGGEVVMDRTQIAPGVGHRALLFDPAGTPMGLFKRSG
jgi:predicted enzyme related to lactoylglutathione lyase